MGICKNKGIWHVREAKRKQIINAREIKRISLSHWSWRPTRDHGQYKIFVGNHWKEI